MQITKLSGLETPHCFMESMNGRWFFWIDHDRHAIRWQNLYGHQGESKFLRRDDGPELYFHPLSNKFGLLIGTNYDKQDTLEGVELNCKRNKCRIGNKTFEPRDGAFNAHVVVDRAGPAENGDIFFFLHEWFHNWSYCRLDTKTLDIIRINSGFREIIGGLYFLDLNGDVLSGFNRRTMQIKRFSLRKRRVLEVINVRGQVYWQPFHSFAWTDDRLFCFETIYWVKSKVQSIDLKSGNIQEFSYEFKWPCLKMRFDSNEGALYVQSHDEVVEDNVVEKVRYHSFRIPIYTPESLYFLAAAALPRPLPSVALRIIQNNRRNPLPLEVY